MMLYEALEKSMNHDHTDELLTDLAKARRKNKKDTIHQKHHMGLHLISHLLFHHQQSDHSKSTAAPSSSKTAASAEYTAWTTTNIRLRLSVSSIPADLHMYDDTAPDEQVHLSDDEDIRNAHIPKVNLQQDWWKPYKKDRPATPEPAWSIPPSDLCVLTNNWASALTSTYTPPPENSLLAPALSISKMKAAYYPDVRLEKMVPDQMWIKKECKYDIAAMYGISHWWFQRQQFYIDKHTSKGDRRAVRTDMWILSVVRIEVFSMYGCDYMKKIILRRADLNEHIMAKRDFKYLYLSNFEDLYLLNLQGHLNHLPPNDKKILTTAVNLWTINLVIRQRVEDFQLEIESYQTQLNLTKPRWEAIGFEYKHDFTLINSPRAITFRDKYEVQMIMRFNEIHKFSDGTLHQIDEALEYRVKEFKVNKMNSGLNTRFWTRKYVDRSKEFMFAIQKRLKTRRIFHNLESFVGGRVREGD
nr:hypothetical protein [Tanacetum cinerariifolium]